MTEIATRDGAAPALQAAPTGLLLWAQEAQQAHQIARSLVRTSFVPDSLRCTDKRIPEDQWDAITAGNITAAILTGNELGLRPMAALRSTDIIKGTPAMRAHTMRGLVQSHGHDVEPVSATDERVVMRGRRKGSTTWIEVEWTIDRAKRLGAYARNEQYKTQPKSMLTARATGEICRLVAADVLLGMPYASEELDMSEDGPQPTTPSAGGPVTAAEILGANGSGSEATTPAAAQDPGKEPETNGAAEQPPPPPDRPDERQMKRLHAVLGGLKLGGDDRRDDRNAVLSDLAGRPIGSSKELSPAEAENFATFLAGVAKGQEPALVVAEMVERGRTVQGQKPEAAP
jgi:hypothetical protein